MKNTIKDFALFSGLAMSLKSLDSNPWEIKKTIKINKRINKKKKAKRNIQKLSRRKNRK